ncbi:MAG TPA: phosphatase PAP2 family protein [Gemmatimonadaceae bacterium]|nr:phosphatase PAP2 family protein [Gemmatimonadaceae bacterium]
MIDFLNPTTVRPLLQAATVLVSLALAAPRLFSQSATLDSTHKVDKTFFTRQDAVMSAAAFAVSAGVSVFDLRVANWSQQPSIQGSAARRRLVNDLTVVNEQPLTIGAALTYGIGRLAGSPLIADVGLHTTETLVLTVAMSELIRSPLGRERPRVSQTTQYKFKFGGGFTDFAARSYPSIHAAAAFGTAAALTSEIGERSTRAEWIVGPVLYTAALIPPLSRIYLDQHWASDIVAGAFLGTLLGNKVVQYAHSHRRSKLDRWLLGTIALPNGTGGVLVMKSIDW